VGRFEYIASARVEVIKWINDVWKHFLGYFPRYVTLMKGWVCFQFMKETDLQSVLDRAWLFGKGSLVLQRWHVAFNPLREPILKRHLWMLIPGLPLHLWSKEILVEIANKVGKYIYVDEDALFSLDRKMARVLVEFQVMGGLPEEIDICWGNKNFVQKLDYLGIPFRCHLCRRMSHLRNSCLGKVG
jgi:hypothetical protein